MGPAEKFAMMLEMTDDEELGCEEVYALIDQYAELLLRGEDPKKLMPLVEKHLALCKDCREELEALLRILEG
jgi:hypothetical protein